MKYIIVDDCKTEIFTEEYDCLFDAIKAADLAYSYLTSHDKKRRVSFCVLESDNPDENADNHFEGIIRKEYICAEDGIY